MEEALQITLELAEATHALLLHLEVKQKALNEEQVPEIGALLGQENLLVKRINRMYKALDKMLAKLGLMSADGGYSPWLEHIYSLCSAEDKVKLTTWAEDTIACQEMQLRQAEIMQHSLIYYSNMARFFTSTQDITYAPGNVKDKDKK